MTGEVRTLARGDHSRIASPTRAIARTLDEWEELWTAHAGPDVLRPEVDFSTRIVAAVFAGERPVPGHDIVIAPEPRAGSGYLLRVHERQPPDGTLAAQVTTTPFHIISLPRVEDGELEFVEGGPLPRTTPVGRSGRRRHAAAPSSTGLTPPAAGALAYLAGPLSGALLLATESSSRYVKFHAWQAVVGLGVLGFFALVFFALAFLLLLLSPTLFWVMLWLSALTAVVWIAAWGACLFQASRGRVWKLPLAGRIAERRAGLVR